MFGFRFRIHNLFLAHYLISRLKPTSISDNAGIEAALRLYVVIPVYNERETIGEIVVETRQVLLRMGIEHEIVVVDDASIDGTGEVAESRGATVLRNQENRGKGYSIRRGLAYAENGFVVTIDGDGNLLPSDIPKVVEPILSGQADAVIGSRFLSQRPKMPWIKLFGARWINILVFAITGCYFSDVPSGFRAYSPKALSDLNLDAEGFEVEVEMTVEGLRKGYRFVEAPISYTERNYGVSRIHILKVALRILETAVRKGLRRYA